MHLPFITLNDKNKTRIKNDETKRKRWRRRKRGGDEGLPKPVPGREIGDYCQDWLTTCRRNTVITVKIV